MVKLAAFWRGGNSVNVAGEPPAAQTMMPGGGSQLVGVLPAFAGSVASPAANFLFVVMAILFLVADGPRLMGRLRAWLGSDHLLVAHEGWLYLVVVLDWFSRYAVSSDCSRRQEAPPPKTRCSIVLDLGFTITPRLNEVGA